MAETPRIEASQKCSPAQPFSDDMDQLRQKVNQLECALQAAEASLVKMCRENSNLMMDVKERDSRIESLKQELSNYHVRQPYHTQSDMDRFEQHNPGVLLPVLHSETPPPSPTPIPPPPPPPPPPQPSINNLYANSSQVSRSRRASSSKYMHPLALNLCFPSLKPLNQNTNVPPATSSSPTSPFDLIEMNKTHLYQMPNIAMKASPSHFNKCLNWPPLFLFFSEAAILLVQVTQGSYPQYSLERPFTNNFCLDRLYRRQQQTSHTSCNRRPKYQWTGAAVQKNPGRKTTGHPRSCTKNEQAATSHPAGVSSGEQHCHHACPDQTNVFRNKCGDHGCERPPIDGW